MKVIYTVDSEHIGDICNVFYEYDYTAVPCYAHVTFGNFCFYGSRSLVVCFRDFEEMCEMDHILNKYAYPEEFLY